MTLPEQYRAIRQASETICRPLRTEDYVVQPVVDVSPPKWHLGHTTWFWETFVLMKYDLAYKVYNPDYNYVFNSYYETVGARVIRTDRGNLSRPSVEEIYAYRKYVDAAMERLLASCATDEYVGRPSEDLLRHGPPRSGPSVPDNEPPARSVLRDILLLGLNHEQQHQELLWSDIKYILGHNPLFPAYSDADPDDKGAAADKGFVSMAAGIYEIGFEGDGFCFDNEKARHKVYLNDYEIAGSLVTNEEFIAFIQAGGYGNFIYWHAEGWDWVKVNQIKSPLYWHMIDGKWHQYTLAGLRLLDMKAPVCHISYYEAVAYAAWRGMRLPTESEWEAASGRFGWGKRWEWTESAYLPYPGFKKAEGAIGEYNGKFMVNQMVLRGASVVTPAGHSRDTYRNFFHPHLRWQFTGIRLAK